MDNRVKIGISACLLGERVRYDGGHQLDRSLIGVLGKFFTFVPVCPEVGCGLSTPREAMRLITLRLTTGMIPGMIGLSKPRARAWPTKSK